MLDNKLKEGIWTLSYIQPMLNPWKNTRNESGLNIK